MYDDKLEVVYAQSFSKNILIENWTSGIKHLAMDIYICILNFQTTKKYPINAYSSDQLNP